MESEAPDLVEVVAAAVVAALENATRTPATA